MTVPGSGQARTLACAGARTAAVDRIDDPFTGTTNLWTQSTWSLGWT